MSQSEAAFKYNELIVDCDLLIKAGDLHAVHAKLALLNLAQVPRTFRQSLAKICRRSGLISTGLKLLQPVVRNDKPQLAPPTANEICEYAVLLSRIGSTQEAMVLLQEVDAGNTPEALLYLAYCHIARWEYERAAELLERFLTSTADEYTKLIARVNLASSYLAVYRLKEALHLLTETIPIAERAGSVRLVANCYDLLGHVHFFSGDFSQSRQVLDQALKMVSHAPSYDQLLIYKTQCFMTAIEKKTIEPLQQFQAEAIARQHWESVRETDLYRAKVHFEQKTLDHVSFGSPMKAFRERIVKEVGVEPSETYIYGSTDQKILDLKTGELLGAKLNAGKKIHQVVSSLVKDFYAPRNLGSLFADLYPNEYFDINSSRHRVNQLLSRTRVWLKENQIAASIEELNGSYRLLVHPGFGIQISLETAPVESFSVRWRELQKAMAEKRSFSAADACESLSWPRSKFRRVAEWAIQAGELEKSGVGKSTIYHFETSTVQKSQRKAS